MRLYSFLALLLCPAALAADEPSSEEIFALLCHRKPPAGSAGDDLKLRREFHGFLSAPRLTVRALERSVRAGQKDVSDSIGELYLYSSTCHLAHTFAKELKSRGCFDGKGRRLPVDQAIRLCAPVAEKFMAAEKKAAPGGEAIERREVMGEEGPTPEALERDGTSPAQ